MATNKAEFAVIFDYIGGVRIRDKIPQFVNMCVVVSLHYVS